MNAKFNRHRFYRLICLTLMILVAPCGGAASAAELSGTEIGQQLRKIGSLRDTLGNARLVSDLEGKATVLAFVGTECPIASLEVPKLVAMDQQYSDQDVTFVLVYPNQPETLTEIAAHAYERDVPFLVLKDFDAELADTLGVTRTPTVCLLDENKQLRYRGRIDDQYSVSSRRATAKNHDLRDALDAVLAGEPVPRSEISADGCPLNRSQPRPNAGDWTYHQHIAPLMRQACVDCHRPGQIGPMQLTSYDDVSDHAETILEVIQQRRMPPWHADPRFGHFSNARSLSEDQIGMVTSWFEAGMPIGEAAADETSPAETENGSEWRIKPDAIYQMPETAEIPATGVVPYIYYVVPTNFEEERWVVAAEARAGNPEVVHHVIAYYVAPGHGSFFTGDGDVQILAIGGPGEGIFNMPEGTALRLPKGTELIFEMHYTPNGVATKDCSSVGVVFTDQPPEREMRMHMFGTEELEIPPHHPHHAHTADFTFAKNGSIFALLPHMHWRGKSYQAWIDSPGGKKEILLSVPRYDFNWQTYYRYADPIEVKAGTTIKSIAHWDNSANNLANPDPSVEVEYGLQSSEEMMYGFLTYIYDEPVKTLPKPKKNIMASMMFTTLDKDKNGLIETHEVPKSLQQEITGAGMQIRGGITPLLLEALMNE